MNRIYTSMLFLLISCPLQAGQIVIDAAWACAHYSDAEGYSKAHVDYSPQWFKGHGEINQGSTTLDADDDYISNPAAGTSITLHAQGPEMHSGRFTRYCLGNNTNSKEKHRYQTNNETWHTTKQCDVWDTQAQ